MGGRKEGFGWLRTAPHAWGTMAACVAIACGTDPGNGSVQPHPLPDCPLPFVEPAAVEAVLPEPDREANSFVAWSLPEEASPGPGYHQFWLSEGERFYVDLEIGSGARYDGPARRVELYLLVNGLAKPLIVGDIRGHAFGFMLEPDTSKHVRIENGAAFPAGKSFVSVVVVFHGQSRLGPHVFSINLLAVKDFACSSETLEPIDTEPAQTQDGMSYLLDPRTGRALIFTQSAVTLEEGRIPLRLHLASSPLMPNDRFLVALLDGRQVPLGLLGERPLVKIPQGSDDREVDFELGNLPEDGSPHEVLVMMFGDYDFPLEQGSEVGPSWPNSDLIGSFTFQ